MSLTQRETDIWRVEAMIDIKKTVADVMKSYMGNRGEDGNSIRVAQDAGQRNEVVVQSTEEVV